jgi:hypothetical protein
MKRAQIPTVTEQYTAFLLHTFPACKMGIIVETHLDIRKVN